MERVDTIDLGFPIGLVDEIAEFVGQATVQLQPGDGVVLYTDGVTEAENMAATSNMAWSGSRRGAQALGALRRGDQGGGRVAT